MPTFQEIVDEVNTRAVGHPIGQLPNLRKELLRRSRKHRNRVFEEVHDGRWAISSGGRTELQFNIGTEEGLGEGDLRYGVAFSFEPSRSLPDIDRLVPKVRLFNDYLVDFGEHLADLLMWHHNKAGRSALTAPLPIRGELIAKGTFVFLGSIGRSNAPDYENILETLDRLLPLYRFVEGNANGTFESTTFEEDPLRPGWRERPLRTTALVTQRAISIDLHHNALQRQLYDELVEEHGKDYVQIERNTSSGGRIDVFLWKNELKVVFEIKTAATARGCVREAIGQLLDYGCWPGTKPVSELVVVGEPEPDEHTKNFLRLLSERFPVPIIYRQITLCAQST